MSTEFVIFAPFLAIVALMLVAFGIVQYLDNRP
jgi:Flp pilus assembly protein TadG